MQTVKKPGKMKQMPTKSLILITKKAQLIYLKNITHTQITVQVQRTRQTIVLFQIVNFLSLIIHVGAQYHAYKLCMTLRKEKKSLFGTDMIQTIALIGIFLLGNQVRKIFYFTEFQESIQFSFLGNFTVPDSMKTEYGVG